MKAIHAVSKLFGNLKFTKMKLLFAVIVILFVSGCQKTGHYEAGMEHLSNKEYAEAIAEFQKIDPGEKQYPLAQSKISYIQGMLAFRDSLFEVAEIQLLKVKSDDEFYHESQLMLEKIKLRNTAVYVPNTDTLVIRDETTGSKGTEREKDKVKVEVETDEAITKKFISEEIQLIEKFESLYQSGYKASVESKKNYLSNMQSIAARLNALSYNAKEKDAHALELKQKATQWMNKRIEFISKLINDNTAAETNTSRSIKEEGDKLYYAVTTQMKKVR
jgi:hypothetical protein